MPGEPVLDGRGIVGDTVTLSSEVLKRDSTSVDEETVRGNADTLTLRNTW